MGKESKIFSLADDPTSSSRGKSAEEVREKLEKDAEEILKFCALVGGKPIKNYIIGDEWKTRRAI